jgi:XTP/dITP diphosphohydrolase
MIQLVCASANPHKVAEIQAIFDDAGAGQVELLPRPTGLDDVIEDADTLVGNARLKASAVASASGLPAVADDTGLEVAALGGAPGVRTARFAGESATDADNRRKLLSELADVDDRRARFVTVAMVVWPDGRELAVDGVCDGTIATSERGAAGFGYDSLFVPAEGGGLTFAELGTDAKHAISHRGRALRALFSALAPR